MAAALAAAIVASVTGCDNDARADTFVPVRSSVAADLDRFRATLPEVTTLSEASATPEALVRRVVTAAARRDTAALVRAWVSRAEWAWLYFPHSPFMRPPYEMPPEVQWHLSVQASEKGVHRLLRELGGTQLRIEDVACAPPGDSTSRRNRVWGPCRAAYSIGGATQSKRLVGAIFESGGGFKILSYANDY